MLILIYRLVMFIVCLILPARTQKRYQVCSFGVQTDSQKCNRGKNLSLKCERGFINITDVFYRVGNRTCNNNLIRCNTCCENLTRSDDNANTFVTNICNGKSSCRIPPPKNAGRSFTVYYRCMQITEEQTGSDDFPAVTVATSISIIVVLACVIILVAVVRFLRRMRKKKDSTYANNNRNHNNNTESFSNPAYASDSSDNISQNPTKSVERATSFSQDSGYAECKDVETDGVDNGEYHTINFHQTTPNIDPAYSHIPKQAQMIDNTYSHITSETKTQTVASNSNANGETSQLKTDTKDTTYNTLQTHAVNKPANSLPFTDEVSENEYNHAVFTATPSKLADNDVEYSHLKSTNNDVTNATPTQRKASSNNTEYAIKVIKDKNKPDIHEDRVTDHANQKLEGTSDNIGQEDFVAEKEPGNDNVNVTGETDSISHDYFVLLKQ